MAHDDDVPRGVDGEVGRDVVLGRAVAGEGEDRAVLGREAEEEEVPFAAAREAREDDVGGHVAGDEDVAVRREGDGRELEARILERPDLLAVRIELLHERRRTEHAGDVDVALGVDLDVEAEVVVARPEDARPRDVAVEADPAHEDVGAARVRLVLEGTVDLTDDEEGPGVGNRDGASAIVALGPELEDPRDAAGHDPGDPRVGPALRDLVLEDAAGGAGDDDAPRRVERDAERLGVARIALADEGHLVLVGNAGEEREREVGGRLLGIAEGVDGPGDVGDPVVADREVVDDVVAREAEAPTADAPVVEAEHEEVGIGLDAAILDLGELGGGDPDQALRVDLDGVTFEGRTLEAEVLERPAAEARGLARARAGDDLRLEIGALPPRRALGLVLERGEASLGARLARAVVRGVRDGHEGAGGAGGPPRRAGSRGIAVVIPVAVTARDGRFVAAHAVLPRRAGLASVRRRGRARCAGARAVLGEDLVGGAGGSAAATGQEGREREPHEDGGGGHGESEHRFPPGRVRNAGTRTSPSFARSSLLPRKAVSASVAARAAADTAS